MTQNESPSFQFVAVHVHPLWRNFQIDFLPPVSAELREVSAHSSELMLPQMPEPVHCAGSSGSGMWWLCRGGVLRYCGHWVGDMSNGDLWSLGTRKWAPMWGQATMLWSECWEPGERGISDQMWAEALFSIESWSLMCCVLLVISWRSDQWWRRDGTGHNELIVLGCINGSYHRHLLTAMLLVMWPSHRMLPLLIFLKSVFVAKISLGNTSGVISRSHWLAVTADTGLTNSGDKTSYFVLGRGLMNCNNVLEAQQKLTLMPLMVGCINPQISP